ARDFAPWMSSSHRYGSAPSAAFCGSLVALSAPMTVMPPITPTIKTNVNASHRLYTRAPSQIPPVCSQDSSCMPASGAPATPLHARSTRRGAAEARSASGAARQARLDRVEQGAQAERHILYAAVDEERRRRAHPAVEATLQLLAHALQIHCVIHL